MYEFDFLKVQFLIKCIAIRLEVSFITVLFCTTLYKYQIKRVNHGLLWLNKIFK